MSTLAQYRALVPAHDHIPPDVVEAALASAAARHTASEWGAVYGEAMCWFAAHRVERTPKRGKGSADEAGAITSQTDSQSTDTGKSSSLSRSYAAPRVAPADAELATTRYGLAYLGLRDSRAASAPFFVC